MWTSIALEDIQEIQRSIGQDNPAAARREARKIRKSVLRLEDFPLSGRELETIPGIREIITGPYHIFYEVGEREVRILRVLHGRRNLPMLP